MDIDLKTAIHKSQKAKDYNYNTKSTSKLTDL